jgi:uncharacterized pyridoxamine 5'-phosphate oxidase family protein
MGEGFGFINFWNDHHSDSQIRYYNHLKEFVLDEAGIKALMNASPICMAAWVAKDGSPRAIALPFALLDDEHVYFTAEESQPIVKALREDPRISMCWGLRSDAATLRGRAEIHTDADLTRRVREASAKQRYPKDPEKARKLALKLDSPTRVTIQVSDEKFITFTGANLPRD